MVQKQNYNTKSRKYILEFLESRTDTTVAASDILEYLNSKDISVNLTTVYRYLNKLTKEQKVIKFTGENSQKALYQLAHKNNSCEEHIHIQCIDCGKLIHLDCRFMNELKYHIAKEHDFKLKCTGSVLYGICKDCEK